MNVGVSSTTYITHAVVLVLHLVPSDLPIPKLHPGRKLQQLQHELSECQQLVRHSPI